MFSCFINQWNCVKRLLMKILLLTCQNCLLLFYLILTPNITSLFKPPNWINCHHWKPPTVAVSHKFLNNIQNSVRGRYSQSASSSGRSSARGRPALNFGLVPQKNLICKVYCNRRRCSHANVLNIPHLYRSKRRSKQNKTIFSVVALEMKPKAYIL